jgi:NitT/TauT family transport system substrate-binding protein
VSRQSGAARAREDQMKFVVLTALLLAGAQTASAADVVRMASTKNSGDIGTFIAVDRGLFAAEGIDAQLIEFDTGARMVAPLATGELDVGTLPGSAAVYNAAARQIEMRIVADRSRSAPNNFYQTLMVRKDLIESGRFKSYADLKGLKMAIPAPGLNVLAVANEAAKKGGVKYEDIEKVYITLPQQVAAFKNKSVDVSIMIEPFATAIVNAGDGVRFASTEDFNPGFEFTTMIYSEKFSRERPELAKRFMRAYVRALRVFTDAIENGKWRSTPAAEEVIAILARRLEIPAASIRNAYPHAVDPDGFVNLEAMRRELAFFKEQGLVESRFIKVEDLVDMQFVEAAVKELGPYKRAP